MLVAQGEFQQSLVQPQSPVVCYKTLSDLYHTVQSLLEQTWSTADPCASHFETGYWQNSIIHTSYAYFIFIALALHNLYSKPHTAQLG